MPALRRVIAAMNHAAPTGYYPLVIHSGPALRRMSDHEFFEFCQANPELRIERTSEGDLIITPPTTSDTGRRNFNLTAAIARWAEADGTGVGFDSSTGFRLPNGATRSPDVAWVPRAKWECLNEDERQKFAPLCPDFVVELRSPSDSLRWLKAKMDEYIANGAQLGWLIDPLERTVYVYRPGAEPERLENPSTVSGDPTLRGLSLSLDRIW
jgi:Uma2 family endonuclease